VIGLKNGQPRVLSVRSTLRRLTRVDVQMLEGLARWVHGSADIGTGPVDAFDLLDWLELELVYEPGARSRREPGRIIVGTRVPARRLHSTIAHECAHEILDRVGELNDDPSANRLGAALLAPTPMIERGLREGWDLYRIMGEHVNASAELLARRVAELRHASVAVYDQGRFRYRTGLATPLPIERAIVQDALATGRPVRVSDLSGAWPIVTGHRQRVIVLGAGHS
jgi:hypothetical protein